MMCTDKIKKRIALYLIQNYIIIIKRKGKEVEEFALVTL